MRLALLHPPLHQRDLGPRQIVRQHVERLRISGEEIATVDLAKISPMAFHHVIPNGTYHFRGANRQDNIAYNTLE